MIERHPVGAQFIEITVVVVADISVTKVVANVFAASRLRII